MRLPSARPSASCPSSLCRARQLTNAAHTARSSEGLLSRLYPLSAPLNSVGVNGRVVRVGCPTGLRPKRPLRWLLSRNDELQQPCVAIARGTDLLGGSCTPKLRERHIVFAAKSSEGVSPTMCVRVPPLSIPACVNEVGRSEDELKGVGEERYEGLHFRVLDVAGTTMNEKIAALDSHSCHELQLRKPPSQAQFND